jgi:hypothetical protein
MENLEEQKDEMFERLTDPLKHSELQTLATLLINDHMFQDDLLEYIELNCL